MSETIRSDPRGAYPCVAVDVYNGEITGETETTVTGESAIGADMYNFVLTGGVATTLTANTGCSSNHAEPTVITFAIDHVVCGGATARRRVRAITRRYVQR